MNKKLEFFTSLFFMEIFQACQGGEQVLNLIIIEPLKQSRQTTHNYTMVNNYTDQLIFFLKHFQRVILPKKLKLSQDEHEKTNNILSVLIHNCQQS